jgi:hypothetical protein
MKRGRAKKKPSGKSQVRRKKKALAGPPKPAAKKQAKRRGIVAAARRRIDQAFGWAVKSTRKVDRSVNRRMERLHPVAARHARRGRAVALRWAKKVGNRLRPAIVLLLRGFSRAERALRRGAGAAARAATKASAVLTPQRAVCAVVLASAAFLVVSQFVAYRGVEIGRPGYAGLPAVASPPTVGVEVAGSAHGYVLIPIALAAALLAVLALRPGRRGLGRVVCALGLLGTAIVLAVDLPAGLDAGAETSRFAGATAVLDDGFYAELVACIALAMGGALLARTPKARKHRRAKARRSRRKARALARRKRSERPVNRPRTQPDKGLQRSAATIPRRA